MEKINNTGYIGFELRLIDKKRKLKSQNNQNNVFSNQQQIANQSNDSIDKQLALFLVMIPAKGTNQIVTSNNRVINATLLDKDKKIAIRLQTEDIVNILDMIYKYEQLIGFQNNNIVTNNDDFKYTIFRDKKEKTVNVNISKRFVYFSNKALNIYVGFELLYVKLFLEAILKKIIDSEIQSKLTKTKQNKIVYE